MHLLANFGWLEEYLIVANMKLDVKLKGLEQFSKKIKEATKYETRIGFLGSEKASRENEGIKNPDLAALHHFGSITKKIPSRSPFIGFYIKEETNELNNVFANALKQNLKNPDVEKVFSKAGIVGENIIDSAFETGGFGRWQKISPKTAKKKGNDKILIETDQLHKSRVSKVIKK